ncbi:MAG: hypothetical protein HKN50_01990 [Gammaproteobacteria bacterium]|nr:hypothetical protein [Gammaproteobacteria bacterium]
MSAIIYINDHQILIEQNQKFERSQGYAWIRGESVIFDADAGASAVRHCRLSPQQIYSRYWQQCDQSSLPANQAGIRHAADLIYQHLSELKQRFNLQEIALVVPSHYQTANLQLLLGIAQACQLKVNALVNGPLLALYRADVISGKYQHVDMQLNQTVCSEFIVAHAQIELVDVQVHHDISLQSVQDSLLKTMQHNFIQNDRFDPLHYAATEQQLFDQIPQVARAIGRDGKTSLLVEHQGQTHNVSIDARQWKETLAEWFNKLSLGNVNGYDSRFLQLNGLLRDNASSLPELPGTVVLTPQPGLPLPPEVYQRDQNGELIYVNRLGCSENVTTAESQPSEIPPVDENAVTHLLCNGRAVPLERAFISPEANQLSVELVATAQANLSTMLASGDLFVLNAPDRQELLLNDRLGSNLADGVVTAIRVRS